MILPAQTILPQFRFNIGSEEKPGRVELVTVKLLVCLLLCLNGRFGLLIMDLMSNRWALNMHMSEVPRPIIRCYASTGNGEGCITTVAATVQDCCSD